MDQWTSYKARLHGLICPDRLSKVFFRSTKLINKNKRRNPPHTAPSILSFPIRKKFNITQRGRSLRWISSLVYIQKWSVNLWSEKETRTTPKTFKRQVTQILTPDGPVPVLVGKIEPILYDELCVMAQWLIQNSESSELAETATQTYQMWIG